MRNRKYCSFRLQMDGIKAVRKTCTGKVQIPVKLCSPVGVFASHLDNITDLAESFSHPALTCPFNLNAAGNILSSAPFFLISLVSCCFQTLWQIQSIVRRHVWEEAGGGAKWGNCFLTQSLRRGPPLWQNLTVWSNSRLFCRHFVDSWLAASCCFCKRRWRPTDWVLALFARQTWQFKCLRIGRSKRQLSLCYLVSFPFCCLC